jgi:hypothetical protein
MIYKISCPLCSFAKINLHLVPKLLFACMDRIGIYERPEYSSREYEDRDTLRCEMIIFIGRSRRFPDIDPFNVTATGFRLQDTYQVAARKALR